MSTVLQKGASNLDITSPVDKVYVNFPSFSAILKSSTVSVAPLCNPLKL